MEAALHDGLNAPVPATLVDRTLMLLGLAFAFEVIVVGYLVCHTLAGSETGGATRGTVG